LEENEEALNMPYVTSIERRARQEGFQEGFQQGLQEAFQEGFQEGFQQGMLQVVQELLPQTLQVRFGTPPALVLQKIEQCQDVAMLRAMHQQALTASSIAELPF
jgi:flagellar biosynthesis/type III secretory pathway protein FliH